MNEWVEPFDRLLGDACPTALVREVEAGKSPDRLWEAIEDSGFLDALVPEALGGHGLSLSQACGLMAAVGRHAVPAPVVQTMFARAALAQAGATVFHGSVAIAASAQHSDGVLLCRHVPCGRVAQWIIVPLDHQWRLLPRVDADCLSSGIQGSLHADLRWQAGAGAAFESATVIAWQQAGAVGAAAQMVGAMERVLEMTLAFANDRTQFGRSIGKFQAIQHQLAVLAEHITAARMAAQIGCDSHQPWPAPMRAALAKARVSEAAALVAPMAHAIHGAIGVTAEFDLQLFTRRLHEWRSDHGSERHWNTILGRALLDSGVSTLDFMLTELLPS
ncbi:MAG: acyl-CoA dehydrogenase family protein [Ideonella sp.]